MAKRNKNKNNIRENNTEKFRLDPWSLGIGASGTAIAIGVILIIVWFLKTKKSSTAPVLAASVQRRKYLMGTYSGYNSSFSGMWNVDDFIYTDLNGKKIPWQNIMITEGSTSWDYYATVWTAIYKETGIKPIIFWKVGFNSPDDVLSFSQSYSELQSRFPELPLTPSGVIVCDKPTGTQVLGDVANSVISLNYLCSILKTYWPDILLYGNFTYNHISTRPDIVQEIGNMSLDYISVQDFTVSSTVDFQNTLKQNLYPNIKDSQKVLIVSNAAYNESSTPGSSFTASAADSFCFNVGQFSALSSYTWLSTDDRIYGIIIYKLKNLNWSNSGDITTNPNGTGVGLVDKLPSTSYVMPNTVKFYQNLGAVWTSDNVKYDL